MTSQLSVQLIFFFLVVVYSAYALDKNQGCKRLDAALHYHNKDYLFVGQDYVQLDDQKNEVLIESKEKGWGGLSRIDAAFVFAKDGYPYFFEGATYSYYSAWRARTLGPYPNSDWSSDLKLEEGCDAAATLESKSYFFKCCYYRVYDDDTGVYEDRVSLDRLGVLCDVDAAIRLDHDRLGVIKYDRLWTLYNNGTVTGPVDANTVLHLKSFRLCGEYEDEGASLSDK